MTRFNNALSHERQFAFRDFSLNELNTVRRAAGLTFNDMGLAVLAGALRRYLEEIDQLPGESLVCNVPVAGQVHGASDVFGMAAQRLSATRECGLVQCSLAGRADFCAWNQSRVSLRHANGIAAAGRECHVFELCGQSGQQYPVL